MGDADQVMVEDAGTVEHAAPWAELWCARYGKTARFRSTHRHHHGRYTQAVDDVQFDCVARE